MRKLLRVILAILAGIAVWTLFWLAGTALMQSLYPDLLVDVRQISNAGVLWAYILYSTALSVLAGYTTARFAGQAVMLAVYVLAGVQLTLGILAEVSYWQMMPAWYHVVFLALVVPATIYGGRLRAATAAEAA